MKTGSMEKVQKDQRNEDWYKLSTQAVLEGLESSGNGLPKVVVAERIAAHGFNELIERGAKSPWVILWEQLTAVMVVILIVAAIISAFLGDFKDAIAILAIVVLNAVLGFTQEYRAEKAMAALRKLAVPVVKVRREGHVFEISARELVPGDIVILEAGGHVPADGRLLESVNLRVLEAALTGESEPVRSRSSRSNRKMCRLVTGLTWFTWVQRSRMDAGL
jgi:P-type Ca2+ transporter type 2C